MAHEYHLSLNDNGKECVSEHNMEDAALRRISARNRQVSSTGKPASDRERKSVFARQASVITTDEKRDQSGCYGRAVRLKKPLESVALLGPKSYPTRCGSAVIFTTAIEIAFSQD